MKKEFYLSTYNLDTHPGIDVLEYSNEEDWLQLRRKGIGGSDVGAILGLNDYVSPLQVYKAKVENISQDLSNNVNVKKGNDLESLIRMNYVAVEFAKQGYTVKKVQCMLINQKYPWLRANLDGIAIKNDSESHTDNIVIEIKYVSEWGETKWNGDDYFGIPASYYAQVQTYMAVTGAKKAVVCALFDSSWTVKYYTIPRNESFINDLIKKTKLFYEYHMEMKIPPAFKTGVDTEDIATAVKEEPVETYENSIMDALIGQYKDTEAQIKELTNVKNDVKNELVNLYVKGGRPKFNPKGIKITSYETTSFEAAKFRKDYPEMYENYAKHSTALKVTIK